MPVIEQKTTNKNKVDFDLNRLDKSKTTIFSKYPKFYCFNGEPLAILYMTGRGSEHMQAAFFDLNWNMIGTTGKRNYQSFEATPPAPASLNRMAEAARILSKDFKFVRVDLYDVDGKPFFGEMTFTPAGGFDVSQCRINGQSMGELLKI